MHPESDKFSHFCKSKQIDRFSSASLYCEACFEGDRNRRLVLRCCGLLVDSGLLLAALRGVVLVSTRSRESSHSMSFTSASIEPLYKSAGRVIFKMSIRAVSSLLFSQKIVWVGFNRQLCKDCQDENIWLHGLAKDCTCSFCKFVSI